MLRQSCHGFAKRSLRSCRCIFRQPQPPQSSIGSVRFSTAPRRIQKKHHRCPKETTRSSSSAVVGNLTHKSRGWVSKEAFQAYLPIIGNGAYMALASGFLMTDMLHLRLLLVGGYAGLVSFHALHAKPLLIPLRWSALFVVVNAGAAMVLFVDQWIGVLLSEDEKALYEEHFKDGGLTPGQFYHLIQMAKKEEISDGRILTEEGKYSSRLYFIQKGQAKVYHHGNFASYVDEGGFVNDVAFQQENTDGGAYGTVITNGDCQVLVWDQTELKDYLAKHPEMDTNMKYTLSKHLVRSLLKQREIRRRVSVRRRNDLPQTNEFQ